ncbi:MAG: non-hydrolyzing UDP-N-acetylglucosamine 2-epimerase [Allosphingosinicella sp.]
MPAERPAIVSIVGTRPEAIKMAPLALALEGHAAHQILLTGQHGGLSRYFDLPGERLRQLRFDTRGSPVRMRERLHRLLCGEFEGKRIDLVLVHGDTTSAVAGAFAARDWRIPVGHVEAGLRSFDFNQPWPEEGNRVAIDALSDLLFAPTEAAADNLRADWRAKGRIWVTGNTGIDALLQARARVSPLPADPRGRRLILVTCHRRENQGEPALAVCEALKRLVRTLPVRIALPVHPNPLARGPVERALAGVEHIELLEPLDYDPMVRLMDSSWLILTDSGGLQEEAPALGKPVLVLRNVTERPEALATGNLELVGTETERIVEAVEALFADESKYRRMARPAFPFGDGKASRRIVAAIGTWLAERRARAA